MSRIDKGIKTLQVCVDDKPGTLETKIPTIVPVKLMMHARIAEIARVAAPYLHL